MRVLRILAILTTVLGALWGSAALWVDGPSSRPQAGGLAVAFALSSAFLIWRGRRLRWARIGFALLFGAVALWWQLLPASNNRDWAADVARLPRAHFDGDLVTIEGVRNFRYHSETDFTPRWEERTLDLSRITGMDFVLSYWGSPWIAHTIMSWSFEEGPPLAISIETRKEAHESYSAVLGFFRQFELYYVVADERDLLGVRTNHRGEEVYLYRLVVSPERARALLLDYLQRINDLAEHPRWYNALSHNCTTTIRDHLEHVAGGRFTDWRILVNGRIDELGYELGTLDTSLPFAELRRRSFISERARTNGLGPEFSVAIREGLPKPGD